MKRVLGGAVLILPVTIVLSQGAFSKSKKAEGSAAQNLMIKSQVETAISMLQTIYSKHENGELTLEQAKQPGADLLRGMRYGKEEYFWADTTEGVNAVLY